MSHTVPGASFLQLVTRQQQFYMRNSVTLADWNYLVIGLAVLLLQKNQSINRVTKAVKSFCQSIIQEGHRSSLCYFINQSFKRVTEAVCVILPINHSRGSQKQFVLFYQSIIQAGPSNGIRFTSQLIEVPKQSVMLIIDLVLTSNWGPELFLPDRNK